MSLVPSKIVTRHWKQRMNILVSSRRGALWCPSAECGRVASFPASKDAPRLAREVAVFCDCGALWCSDCKQDAHWPATCAQAAKYRAEESIALRNGAMNNEVLVDLVRYKSCPRCNNPIDKIMGCKVIACPCKCVFCWECGVEWSLHNHVYVCSGQRVLHQEYEFPDVQPFRHVYEIAVQYHHRGTKSSSVRRLHRAMDLANILAVALYGKRENKEACPQTATPSSAPCGQRAATLALMSHKEGGKSVLEELKDMMRRSDKFLLEADFILEYTEILLGSIPPSDLKRTLVQQKIRLAFVVQQLDDILNKRLDLNKLRCAERIRALYHNGRCCLGWLVKGAANLRDRALAPPAEAEEDEY